MKIAVCIGGYLRDYDTKLAQFRANVIRDHDCDFFVHSWDTVRDFNGDARPANIADILQVINPAAYEFETFADQELNILREASYYTRHYEWDRPPNLVSMLRKIYLCDLLRRKHEQQLGFKYDVVIRTRTDLTFHSPIMIENFDLSVLHTPVEVSYDIISDVFSFANSDVMTRYSDLYINLKNLYDTTKVMFNPHYVMLEYLQQNNIPFAKHHMNLVLR